MNRKEATSFDGHLPADLLDRQPGPWHLQGQGTLRRYFLPVYEARLYTNARTGLDLIDGLIAFEQAPPFVLDILHLRRRLASDLIRIMKHQMLRLRPDISSERIEHWCLELESILPDVQRLHRLCGHFMPGHGVVFYWNDALVGSIENPEFCEVCAAIWLDPRTIQPQLRRALLGLS